MVRKRGSTSMKTGRWPAAAMARTSEGSVNKRQRDARARRQLERSQQQAQGLPAAARPELGTVAQQGERLRQRSALAGWPTARL